MRCNRLFNALASMMIMCGAVVSFANSAHATANAPLAKKSQNSSFLLTADYLEIIIDVATETDRKRYEKNNVSAKSLKILMAPKVRAFLSKEYYSDFVNWQLIQLSPETYQFKHNTWSEYFFHVDLAEPAVYKVTKIAFGSLGGHKERLDIQDISQNNTGDWIIHLPRPQINLDAPDGKALLTWHGIPFAAPNVFKARKINAFTYQLKHEYGNNQFLEIDFRDKTVKKVFDGTFGQSGGTRYNVQGLYPLSQQEQLTSQAVSKSAESDDANSHKPLSNLWPVDTAFTPEDHPTSPWLIKQSHLFQDILTSKRYETLLLPLQVDGYAIDSTGRFLMTLMLHQRLQESGYSLPNPLLLARALGEKNRTFDQESVFRLAAQLGVKEIIVPMAGHNSRHQLKVCLLKIPATQTGQFSLNGKIIQAEKSDLQFSDANPPSLVVMPLLDELLQGVNVKLAPRKPKGTGGYKQPSGLPSSPIELYKAAGTSPLENALFLQLTGLLHPNSSFAKDGLFGRSLITAWELPKENPLRTLLVARALFYLHRRPAAIKLLGTPKTPEEQAFLAYLNGDLISLKKSLAGVAAPLPKLLATLEYQDLLIEYTKKPLDEQTLDTILQPFPGWEMPLTRKLLDKWRWMTQPNLIVKDMMDQAFPIEGYTARGLAESRMALGKSPLEGAEVELSVYEHYQQILKREGANLYGDESIDRVNTGDLLQLLYEISEANLINDVYKSVRMRSLADEALERIGRYEPVYNGLPVLTYLKSEALRLKTRNSRGTERAEYEKQARELETLSTHWNQEQSSFAHDQAFDQDFPKRYYWKDAGHNQSGTIASLKNSLLYTNSKFQIVTSLYDYYDSPSDEVDKKALLLLLENRFVGHPDRQILLADAYAIKGDMEKAKGYLRQAIEILPDAWAPYDKLADFACKEGRLEEAFNLIKQFKPFSEEDPVNSVSLSQSAYFAAQRFYLMGEADKALSIFNMTEKFHSGSGAEMHAAALARLLTSDYQQAAYNFLQGANRYQSGEFLSGYLKLLHLLGQHSQAWAIFNNLPDSKKSPAVYGAALFGLQIEGKSNQEILAWTDQQEPNINMAGFYLQLMMVSDHSQLGQIYDKAIPKRKNGQLSLIAQHTAIKEYINQRINNYDDTEDYFLNPHNNMRLNDLPYMASYVNHFGQLETFRKRLEQYTEKNGISFFQQLAEGIVAGLGGQSEIALEHFAMARLNVSARERYTLPPLFLLAANCEWFYERTNDNRFIEAGLDYARKYNSLDATELWPYAYLAKHSNSGTERQMALGRALFLAPNLEIFSSFSNAEKELARKEFDKNNLFTKQLPKTDKVQI